MVHFCQRSPERHLECPPEEEPLEKTRNHEAPHLGVSVDPHGYGLGLGHVHGHGHDDRGCGYESVAWTYGRNDRSLSHCAQYAWTLLSGAPCSF